MKIAIGSDHAGFALKEELKRHLSEGGVEVEDFGTFSADSVDYPDIGFAVAQAVAEGKFPRGILICGTGIGMSITANKVRGVRAALCHDSFSARAASEHNDANILVMGARVIGPGLAQDIVSAWMGSKFAGGRHAVRVGKISAYESEQEGRRSC